MRPALGPLVAAGLSEANGRASTLDQYAGGFDRGRFDSSPPSPDLESRSDLRAGLRHPTRDRDYHRAGVGKHGAPARQLFYYALVSTSSAFPCWCAIGSRCRCMTCCSSAALACCCFHNNFFWCKPYIYQCRAALPDELLYHCVCRVFGWLLWSETPICGRFWGGSGPVQWRVDLADRQKTRGCRQASSDAPDCPFRWPQPCQPTRATTDSGGPFRYAWKSDLIDDGWRSET